MKLVTVAGVALDVLPPGLHELTVGADDDILLASVDFQLGLVENGSAFVSDLFDLAGMAATGLPLERLNDRLGEVLQRSGNLGDLAVGPADAGHAEGGGRHYE
jgi:hypothetical protein